MKKKEVNLLMDLVREMMYMYRVVESGFGQKERELTKKRIEDICKELVDY